MQKIKTATLVFWVIVTVVPIVGVVLSITSPEGFSLAQEYWRDWVVQFGIFAPLAFIALQALQVVLTPISHYSVGLIGGFLYGPYLGAFLNWTGRMIGHIIAFFLARYIGRSIAERFVSEQTLHRYDKYVSNKTGILFLIYFLPVFPDDEISYLVGLSNMPFSRFFIASALGHVGGSLGLAYIGSGVDFGDPIFWALLVSVVAGFVLVWYLIMKKQKQEKELTEEITE